MIETEKIGEYRFFTGFRIEVFTKASRGYLENGDDCAYIMLFGPFGGSIGKLRLRPGDIRGLSEFAEDMADKIEAGLITNV